MRPYVCRQLSLKGVTHFPEGSTRLWAEQALDGRRREVLAVEGRRLETPESRVTAVDGGFDFVVVCETLAFLDRPNILGVMCDV